MLSCFIEVPVQRQESERSCICVLWVSCICVLEVMYLCLMGIDVVSFYDVFFT